MRNSFTLQSAVLLGFVPRILLCNPRFISFVVLGLISVLVMGPWSVPFFYLLAFATFSSLWDRAVGAWRAGVQHGRDRGAQAFGKSSPEPVPIVRNRRPQAARSLPQTRRA